MTASQPPQNDPGEDIALFRYGVIANVLRSEPGSPGIYAKLREQAAQQYDIPGSSKTRVAAETMRAWVRAYRKHGFPGLYPKRRSDLGRPRSIQLEVVDLLLHKKEESPSLTVKQVIAAVKKDGKVPPDCPLAESTVHRLLQRAGLMLKEDGAGANKDRRQFSYQWAGELMMSDVMHGPTLPKEARRKRKTYLIAFLDDATRVIQHAQFCWSENTATFFPVFKQALLRRGIPLRLYVDNGAAYRARQLELVCAKLGVTLVHARPYQPQGKGKIERFFRTVRMQFLNQIQVDSIDEINQRFWAWVEGEYHQTPHRGLNNETPLDRWAQVAGRIKTVEPQMDLDDLFMWEVKRQVRTDRTVSLNGNLYEAPAELVRQSVTLRYDPGAPASRPLQVWRGSTQHEDAKPLDRHANCFVKREGTKEKPGLNFTQLTDTKE